MRVKHIQYNREFFNLSGNLITTVTLFLHITLTLLPPGLTLLHPEKILQTFTYTREFLSMLPSSGNCILFPNIKFQNIWRGARYASKMLYEERDILTFQSITKLNISINRSEQ